MATIKQVLKAQEAVEKARDALWDKESKRNQLIEACPDLRFPQHWENPLEVFKRIDGKPLRIRVYPDKSVTSTELPI